ncbi:MAG: M48 family metallopeptidase [Bacteroidota bacterium]
MELVYQGRYFDGRSSKPYTVNITWLNNGLLIQYTNDAGEYVEQKWNSQHIHHTQLSGGIVTLRYGEIFPYQQLEVTDGGFISRYRREYNTGFLSKISLTGVPLLFTLVVGVGLSIWLAYLFLLPVIADYGARVFPKEYEIEMGGKLYESILSEEHIDTAKTEAINGFFRQLAIKSEYPVRITVVKNDIVNAFALPGGGIVVYDGILKDMKSADQLAALLSHEYSHVELKHATRNMFRSLAGYLFISVLFSDVNGIAAVLVENAHQLRNLSYSRELETEADNNGLQILKKNHVSASGMKALFEQLKKEDNVQVNELISTHPDLDNRIKNVELFMKKNPYPLQVNDSLLYYFDELHQPLW